MNARRAALDELWHPAAATALERALHPAGHGPNSSSLLRPQAAVVAVAYSAEKLFIIEQCRAVCGPPGIAFSRVGVVAANGICGDAFCESAAQREAGLTPQTLWQNRKA